MGPLENPAVKDGLSDILASLQEQLAALEGIHSSNYPDQPALKADEDTGGQDDDAMKAFLASGRIASLQVLGLGSRLKGLVGARNLTADQRRSLDWSVASKNEHPRRTTFNAGFLTLLLMS